MSITDEDRQAVEQCIDRWRAELAAYLADSDGPFATQAQNWLFGLQSGLETLGLHDLAKLAEDARQPIARWEVTRNSPGEELRRVEARIRSFGRDLKAHRRDQNFILSRTVDGWLFGMEVALAELGLHELSALAADAQKPDHEEG